MMWNHDGAVKKDGRNDRRGGRGGAAGGHDIDAGGSAAAGEGEGSSRSEEATLPIVVLMVHSSTHEPTRWFLDNQLLTTSLCHRLHGDAKAGAGIAAPLDITFTPVNITRTMDRKIGLSCHGSTPQWRADWAKSTLQPHMPDAFYQRDLAIETDVQASATDASLDTILVEWQHGLTEWAGALGLGGPEDGSASGGGLGDDDDEVPLEEEDIDFTLRGVSQYDPCRFAMREQLRRVLRDLEGSTITATEWMCTFALQNRKRDAVSVEVIFQLHSDATEGVGGAQPATTATRKFSLTHIVTPLFLVLKRKPTSGDEGRAVPRGAAASVAMRKWSMSLANWTFVGRAVGFDIEALAEQMSTVGVVRTAFPGTVHTAASTATRTGAHGNKAMAGLACAPWLRKLDRTAGGDKSDPSSGRTLAVHSSQEVRSAALRRVGALVEACSKASGRWNNAEVTRCRKKEMVDVVYEGSGETETNVPLRSIRQRTRSYDVSNLPFEELPLWPHAKFALTRRRVLEAEALAEALLTGWEKAQEKVAKKAKKGKASGRTPRHERRKEKKKLKQLALDELHSAAFIESLAEKVCAALQEEQGRFLAARCGAAFGSAEAKGKHVSQRVLAARLAGVMRVEFKDTPEVALPAAAIERWLFANPQAGRRSSDSSPKKVKKKKLKRKKRKAAARKAWLALPYVAKEAWRLVAASAVTLFVGTEHVTASGGGLANASQQAGTARGASIASGSVVAGAVDDDFVVSAAQRAVWRDDQWHEYIGEDEIAALLFPISIFSEVEEAFEELLDEFTVALNQWTAVMVKKLLLANH